MTAPRQFSPADTHRAQRIRKGAERVMATPCYACVLRLRQAQGLGAPAGRYREQLLERTNSRLDHVCGERAQPRRDEHGAMLYGPRGVA